MITAVFIGACDWMPGKPTKSEESVIPADVHSFNTLYKNNCSGCHGADGQYGGARPLNDPLYIGQRCARMPFGEEYDELMDEFVNAVKRRFGDRVIVQFEDFSNQNGKRLQERYATRAATFNDDISGVAATTPTAYEYGYVHMATMAAGTCGSACGHHGGPAVALPQMV